MKRKRWMARIACGVMALCTLGGCKQNLYLDRSDYKSAINNALMTQLENQPHAPIAPSILSGPLAPATVLEPNRPARPVSLKELIAVAIEKGNVGSQAGLQNAGFISDVLPQFSGRSVSGTDSMRALVLDPAVLGADIERSLSKFDARWINSISWSKQDQAVLNLQQSFSNGDSASFNSTLAKPLPTGGVAGITFSTNYLKLATPPTTPGFVTLNTSYTPQLQFLFEQPLLQNFGVEINQLTSSTPGSLLINGLRPSGGTTTEGILITRIRYDQQRAVFDSQVNQMLINIEFAYWNLYSAYYGLYAQEETLKQAFELQSIIRQRFEAGTLTKQDYTQTLSNYWLFREQVLTARKQVLDAERQLRGLLGSNSFSEGDRLVPIDEPSLAPFQPDYFEAANEALANRPELVVTRHDLKFRQLDLVVQKNARRPDLRFFATYNLNGLGSSLDGSKQFQTGVNAVTGQATFLPQNALASMASNQFNSYQIGLRADIPIGFRDANAAVRQAQLSMLRAYFQLQDTERKTLEQVTLEYRDVIYQHELINFRRQRRVQLQETLRLNKELIDAGNWRVETLFNLLQVQRDAASAIAAEFDAVAKYNQALAGLEYSKGTIQKYNNVSVSDGPLPAHATKKAADYFAARNAAFKLIERPGEFTPFDPANQNLPASPMRNTPWIPASDQMMNPGGAMTPTPIGSNPPATLPGATPTSTPTLPGGVPATPAVKTPATTGASAAPNTPQWPGSFGPVSFPNTNVNAGTDPSLPNPVFKPVGSASMPPRKSIFASQPDSAAPKPLIPPATPVSNGNGYTP